MNEFVMGDALSIVDHRPWALPVHPWVMRQRWHSLLFAHWPIPAAEIAYRLPDGLVADCFGGDAWIGVVPFTIDRIRFRGLGTVPGASRFAELNLRTYVRDRRTGTPGIYFLSLDAANPLAVVAARTWFHLPYYWARMSATTNDSGTVEYCSARRMAKEPVRFRARYRGLGPTQRRKRSAIGSIEHFLTERYCIFTTDRRGQLLQGNLHHPPWPLEEAEAEIELNELPQAHGLRLPQTPPVLYFARDLAIYTWRPQPIMALA